MEREGCSHRNSTKLRVRKLWSSRSLGQQVTDALSCLGCRAAAHCWWNEEMLSEELGPFYKLFIFKGPCT